MLTAGTITLTGQVAGQKEVAPSLYVGAQQKAASAGAL